MFNGHSHDGAAFIRMNINLSADLLGLVNLFIIKLHQQGACVREIFNLHLVTSGFGKLLNKSMQILLYLLTCGRRYKGGGRTG